LQHLRQLGDVGGDATPLCLLPAATLIVATYEKILTDVIKITVKPKVAIR
jgi:hypothetical protein